MPKTKKFKDDLDKVFSNSLTQAIQKEKTQKFAEKIKKEINELDFVWVNFDGYRKLILRSEAIKQGLSFYEKY